MTKFTQIQTELKSIDGGRFQNLCDVYLHARGYSQINRIGSVVGKDKTKRGTPDSYAVLPNGNYTFWEYTTQEVHVVDKLRSDLDKCFDEDKIGIPVDKIEEIILCYLDELEPDDRDDLEKRCQEHGCSLTLIGIGQLSLDLYQQYPRIAKDFLGIDPDTGQILSPEDFISTHDQNRLAAPLEVKFHFREAEVDQAAKALAENELLIVSGNAGVGKTRFALECCQRFAAENTDYDVYCLHNRDLPLYDDLSAYFSPAGNYLILVDDANRIQQRTLVFDLLRRQSDDHKKLGLFLRCVTTHSLKYAERLRR